MYSSAGDPLNEEMPVPGTTPSKISVLAGRLLTIDRVFHQGSYTTLRIIFL